MSISVIRYPASDFLVEWPTTYPASPTDHASKVDETPHDGDTSYNEADGISTLVHDMFIFTPLTIPSNAINIRVKVYSVARHTGVVPTFYSESIAVNGQDAFSDRTTTQIITGSYIEYVTTWVHNPRTGLAWTPAEINGTGSYYLKNFGVAVQDPGGTSYTGSPSGGNGGE